MFRMDQLAVAALVAGIPCAGSAAVPPDNRDRFVAAFRQSCLAGAADRKTQAYCTCAAQRVADVLTPEEYEASQRSTTTPEMDRKLERVFGECRARP